MQPRFFSFCFYSLWCFLWLGGCLFDVKEALEGRLIVMLRTLRGGTVLRLTSAVLLTLLLVGTGVVVVDQPATDGVSVAFALITLGVLAVLGTVKAAKVIAEPVVPATPTLRTPNKVIEL